VAGVWWCEATLNRHLMISLRFGTVRLLLACANEGRVGVTEAVGG
jgi:hypothetical protein